MRKQGRCAHHVGLYVSYWQICSSQPSHPPSLRLIRHGSGTSVKPVVEESPRSVEEGLDASSITTVKLVSDSAGDFGFFVARRGGGCLPFLPFCFTPASFQLTNVVSMMHRQNSSLASAR